MVCFSVGTVEINVVSTPSQFAPPIIPPLVVWAFAAKLVTAIKESKLLFIFLFWSLLLIKEA